MLALVSVVRGGYVLVGVFMSVECVVDGGNVSGLVGVMALMDVMGGNVWRSGLPISGQRAFSFTAFSESGSWICCEFLLLFAANINLSQFWEEENQSEQSRFSILFWPKRYLRAEGSVSFNIFSRRDAAIFSKEFQRQEVSMKTSLSFLHCRKDGLHITLERARCLHIAERHATVGKVRYMDSKVWSFLDHEGQWNLKYPENPSGKQ
ncbi:hypothetical protein Tco_1458267 [Tanacetum coccineum]